MKILSTKDLYSNIGNILHLALCCFKKVPLEATAESIGSVIYQHGCKGRAPILPSTLLSQVQVSWNGPSEFIVATTDILEESLQIYFDGKKPTLKFYTHSKVKLSSKIVAAHMNEPSRKFFCVFFFSGRKIYAMLKIGKLIDLI